MSFRRALPPALAAILALAVVPVAVAHGHDGEGGVVTP